MIWKGNGKIINFAYGYLTISANTIALIIPINELFYYLILFSFKLLDNCINAILLKNKYSDNNLEYLF